MKRLANSAQRPRVIREAKYLNREWRVLDNSNKHCMEENNRMDSRITRKLLSKAQPGRQSRRDGNALAMVRKEVGKLPRERTVRADFIEALQQHPPFRALSYTDQLELAHMIWGDSTKVRHHDGIDGATSYSHQDLTRRYGRGRFHVINETANAFEVGPWSVEHGRTRWFKLTSVYRRLKEYFLARLIAEQRISSFIDMSGHQVRTAPRSLASKRRDGTTAKVWQGVEIPAAVPINTKILTQYYDQLVDEIDGEQGSMLAMLKRRRDAAAMILALAYTDLGGIGVVPMRYREALSGRLYACDVNLQNCPKEVRFAAMDGCCDLDISNCHFALLASMCSLYGYSCPAIQHYLDNKAAVRLELATQLSVDVKVIKECMVALIYDAPLSSSRFASIGKALGKNKAQRLLSTPHFFRLATEVKRAATHLLSHWPQINMSLINSVGCGMPMSTGRKQKLAHLLHGAEALTLRTAVTFLENEQRGNVLLLQHDGLTVSQLVDVAALNAHVRHVTGFDIAFDSKQIVAHRIQIDG